MNDSRVGTPVRQLDKLNLNETSADNNSAQTSRRLFDDAMPSDNSGTRAIAAAQNGAQSTKPDTTVLTDITTLFQRNSMGSIGGKTGDLLAFAQPKPANTDNIPNAYGIIPPYMLEEMIKRDPKNRHHRETLVMTDNVQLAPVFRPAWHRDYKGAREVYDAKGQEVHPGDKARFEGEKPTGNGEVDEAYDFTGNVRSFYKDLFKRNSIDGKGMKFISTVNYGDNYENAFWNGSQMTYGRPGKDSPFKTFVLLDVAGHEITHGVTEKESKLEYYGQSGALNESLSDVFGELVQQRANNQMAKDADWVVGNGIWKDNVKGRGLRDMRHPGTAYDDPTVGKDPQPAHMKDYVKMSGDNGGVHYNSGIPNKAFADFAVAVGGYAWEKPGHIWYEARKEAGSKPSFAQFAYYTIEAAKKLGYNSEIPKLQKAWEDVGVTPSKTDTDTLTPKRAQKKKEEVEAEDAAAAARGAA